MIGISVLRAARLKIVSAASHGIPSIDTAVAAIERLGMGESEAYALRDLLT